MNAAPKLSPLQLPACPHCGQPMRTRRAGIFMSPLKAAIFDAIANAGDFGQSSVELSRLPIWKDRKPVKLVTIRAHVGQINEALEKTPWRIVPLDRRYVLVTVWPQPGAR